MITIIIVTTKGEYFRRFTLDDLHKSSLLRYLGPRRDRVHTGDDRVETSQKKQNVTNLKITMIPSNTLNPLLMYLNGPSASNFRSISKAKMAEKTMLLVSTVIVNSSGCQQNNVSHSLNAIEEEPFTLPPTSPRVSIGMTDQGRPLT